LAHNNLGNALRAKGELDGAIRCYQEAIRLDPKYALAHTNLGVALGDKGELDGAIVCYKQALRLDPKHAKAHTNLGNLLRDKGELDGAIVCYKQAIRLDPKHAPAHNNLGVALRDKGELDGAIACLKEAIRLDPKHATAHNNLGVALRDKGDLDGAVACFKEAIRLHPKHATAHNNLRRTEPLRQALPRLPDVLAGRAEPKTPAEGCSFASLCALPFQQRYASSARLYAQAFAAESKLADDLNASHRYNAACSAARAARGDGVDAPAGAERAALRARALGWLRADLALRKKQAAAADPGQRRMAAAWLARWLAHWLADPNLAGVRPGKSWSALPAEERAEWDAFWGQVRATLAAAQKPPTSAKPTPPQRKGP
jgi:Tfp pilus assembly protein PilF